MEPEEIRSMVNRMWLSTPEAELLGCIALTLAEILDTLRSGDPSATRPSPHVPTSTRIAL